MRTSGNYALIPARGGSKGIPGKNVRLLSGHPVIAYSIMAAKLCSQIDRVIVSTESQDIADIATAYGADVPFLRPVELAQDLSPAIDYVTHTLEALALSERVHPELLTLLLPTTPLRLTGALDAAIDGFRRNSEATGLRSAHELAEPPQKMMRVEEGYLSGFFPDDPRPEYYNLPRQTFPPAYHPNGYIEMMRSASIIETGTLYGPKVMPYITEPAVELDAPQDFDFLEFTIDRHPHPLIEHLDRLTRGSTKDGGL